LVPERGFPTTKKGGDARSTAALLEPRVRRASKLETLD
jgi:hypothetical protein